MSPVTAILLAALYVTTGAFVAGASLGNEPGPPHIVEASLIIAIWPAFAVLVLLGVIFDLGARVARKR